MTESSWKVENRLSLSTLMSLVSTNNSMNTWQNLWISWLAIACSWRQQSCLVMLLTVERAWTPQRAAMGSLTDCALHKARGVKQTDVMWVIPSKGGNMPAGLLAIQETEAAHQTVGQKGHRLWIQTHLSSNPSFATYSLCTLGQMTRPLWASAVKHKYPLHRTAIPSLPWTSGIPALLLKLPDCLHVQAEFLPDWI